MFSSPHLLLDYMIDLLYFLVNLFYCSVLHVVGSQTVNVQNLDGHKSGLQTLYSIRELDAQKLDAKQDCLLYKLNHYVL